MRFVPAALCGLVLGACSPWDPATAGMEGIYAGEARSVEKSGTDTDDSTYRAEITISDDGEGNAVINIGPCGRIPMVREGNKLVADGNPRCSVTSTFLGVTFTTTYRVDEAEAEGALGGKVTITARWETLDNSGDVVDSTDFDFEGSRVARP